MTEGGRELNLDAVLQLGFRRRWLLLAGVIVTMGTAAAAWSLVPGQYESSARLLIQDQQTINPFLEDMVVEWTVKQRLPLIQSVIKSHATLGHVLRELGQIDPDASADEVNSAVQRFARQVEVIGLGGGLVKIKVRANSADAAYQATQALVARFTNEILRPQKQAVEASAGFLGGQIQRLRGEITDLEESVTTFKTDNVTELPDVQRLTVTEHMELRKALVEAEVRAAAAQKRRALSEQKIRQLNPIVRQLEADLVKARAQSNALEHRLSSDHPELAAARERVRWLTDELKRERKARREIPIEVLRSQLLAYENTQREETPLADGTDVPTSEVFQHRALVLELEGARGEIELLHKRLSESSDSLRVNAKNGESLNRLTRDLDIKLALYRSLLEKYEDALVTAELSVFDEEHQVWTVETPVRSTRSTKPALWMVLLGALFGGFCLSVLSLAVLAAFDDSIRGERELASALDAPSLGRMPRGEV